VFILGNLRPLVCVEEALLVRNKAQKLINHFNLVVLLEKGFIRHNS